MAAIRIQFKYEFESKLKALRIKDKFVKEMKSYVSRKLLLPRELKLHLKGVDKDTHRNVDSAAILNKSNNWEEFIVKAFAWEETNDGYHYWQEIMLKFTGNK